MTTFRHSGTLGDLIYSLPVAKKYANGPSTFYVSLHNVEGCAFKYGYNTRDIWPEHQNRLSDRDFRWLKPLLERQPYITDAQVYDGENLDYDLDDFRRVFGRSFVGNYVETYYRAFEIDYGTTFNIEPWLEVDPVHECSVVINRTFRYRSNLPDCNTTWQNLLAITQAETNALFVGSADEHEDFVKTFGVNVKYRPVDDFHEMAQIIAGASTFIGNQSMPYSIAVGLGKPTVLETRKEISLDNNECFFERGELSNYF
jgi:hypothetical protein